MGLIPSLLFIPLGIVFIVMILILLIALFGLIFTAICEFTDVKPEETKLHRTLQNFLRSKLI